MPTLETANAAGMVYKPSIAHANKTRQPLVLSKATPWRTSNQQASHTLVTGDAYNAAQTAMASQTHSPSEIKIGNGHSKSLDEVLFDAKSSAKVLTSHVTMYLREGWRDKLFYQLDNLLDTEEWDPRDKPLQKKSFETFLKAICDLNPTVRPGLGLSYGGNLVAAWTTESNNQLTLEFSQDGFVQMIVTRQFEDEPEIFSGRVNVARLKTALHDFKCEGWIGSST